MIDEDFFHDNPDLLDPDDEPDEIELAFRKIREQVDDDLEDCDDRLADIMRRLPPDEDVAEKKPHQTTGTSPWQVLLGFGVSFAVRVGVLGILLGSWLDKHFGGGHGFLAMAMILLAIFYSFFMLYRDVMRQERKNPQNSGENEEK